MFLEKYFIKSLELMNLIQTNRLNSEYIKPKIISIWNNIKENCELLFKDTNYSFFMDMKQHPSVAFHLDPSHSHSYFPRKNTIEFNIFSLLFSISSISSENRINFTPIVLQAGRLLHELDHYQYAKENDFIGHNKFNIESFNKYHVREFELRANIVEKTFYEKCKNILPKNLEIFILEKPQYIIRTYSFSLQEYLNFGIGIIGENIKIIKRSSIDYIKTTESSAKKHLIEISDFFNINSDLGDEEEYKRIVINY